MPTTLFIGRNESNSVNERDQYPGTHTLVVRHWETDQRHLGRSSEHASENRICDLSFTTMKPLRLQCSSLTQMKTHYSTFLGARMWPARPSFTSGGGLHRRTTIAYWMRESTLECFRLILSLHTWCKVISSARVRTQHCTFGRDKMDHLRHWSTVVQDLKNLRTPLSPPRPRTSLPSPHWLQQWTNHVPTISYLVALITSTQSREKAPDQKC